MAEQNNQPIIEIKAGQVIRMSTINPCDSIPEFKQDCSCPKKKCVRHGKCQECHDYHGAKGKLPYCLRGKMGLSATTTPCYGSRQFKGLAKLFSQSIIAPAVDNVGKGHDRTTLDHQPPRQLAIGN
jgi:predicted CXXCH cytochrome family protein